MISSKLRNNKSLDIKSSTPSLLNKQLRSIFNSLSEMIFCLSVEPGGKFCYHFLNNAFLTGTGLTNDQILNKFVHEIIPPESQHLLFGKCNEAIKNKSSITWEETTVYPSGIKTGKITITPWFDEDDSCTHLIGSVQDISEVKIIEEYLSDIYNFNQTIIETSQIGIWIYDESGQTIKINKAGINLDGGDVEKLLCTNFRELDSWKNSGLYDAAVEALESGNVVKKEIHTKNTLEEELWYEAILTPVWFKDKKLLILMTYDIKERMHAENALKKSEAQLSSATQLAKLGYWELSLKDNMFTFNDQFYAVLKTKAEKVGGYTMPASRYAELFIHEEDNETIAHEIKKAHESTDPGYTRHFDARVIYGNGETGYMAVHFFAVRDDHGQAVKIVGANQDITERKQVQQTLHENEKQLSVAAQIAKLGYWEYDIASRVFTFNDQFYSTFKITAEEVGGYTMSADRYEILFIHPDDKALVREETVKAIKSVDPQYSRQFEHRIIYSTGEIGHMAVRFLTVKNNKGDTFKIFGAIQDIADRKKTEEELAKSERGLKQAQEISHIGNWEIDLLNQKSAWSDETYRILGLNPNEVEPSHEKYMSFVHPDDVGFVTQLIDESNKEKKATSFTHRIVRPDGTIRVIFSESRFVFNNEGSIIGVYGIFHDITVIKEAEESLQKSNNQLLSAQQIASLGYWEWDWRNNSSYWSDEMYRICAIEKNEKIPLEKEFLSMIHPDDRSSFQENYKATLKNNQPLDFEFRMIRNDSIIRNVVARANTVSEKNGKTIRIEGTLQDITERKNYILEIEEQNKKLREIAWVHSHTVRAPVARIMGLANLLNNDSIEINTKEVLGHIVSSAHELDNIIREIVKKTEQVENQPKK